MSRESTLADLKDAWGPTVVSALGCLEAFRRLGFPADDLWVVVSGADKRLSIKAEQGGRNFILDVGELPGSEDEFRNAWTAAVAWWNGGPIPTSLHDEVYRDCPIVRESVPFLLSLHSAGMRTRGAR